MDLRDKLSELNPDALIVEGYDEALIGIGCRYTEAACAVYSEEKIIEILEQEMSYDDAVEFYEFNIACAYVGPHTPIIVETLLKQVA